MAKKRKRKYSPSAGRDVESEMRRYKRGTAKSGRGGKGGKVKSRKQALRSDSQRRGRKETAYRRKKGENNRSLHATTDWLKPEASAGRLELFHSALRRLFVRPPANDRRAVPKTASGKMVVGDFNDKLRTYGDPFGRSLRRPTTRRTRRAPGEAPFRPYLLKLVGQVPFSPPLLFRM